jgi:hypothetical protein
MDEILEDFRKALAEAEKKGLRLAIEKRESELDRAVNHYKQEKAKQEKIRRYFI